MKILVVEDEPSLQEVIRTTLEKERYIVEVSDNLNGAIEKTGVYDYDCILLDIMLPDGSGLDLLQHLKQNRKKEKKKRLPDSTWGQMITWQNISIWQNLWPG